MKRPTKNKTFHILAAAAVLGAALTLTARAVDMYLPPATVGGLQIQPVINSTTPSGSNNAVLNITGLQAPYKILVSSNLTDWTVAGVTSLKAPYHTATVLATNVPAGTAYYNLMLLGSSNWVGKWNAGALSASNAFVGVAKCNGCHGDKVAEWSGTAHARAISALVDTNTGLFTGHASDTCIPCHTVGKNQPGGYVNYTNSARLANVQCENCHGAASAHVNISGRVYHPANTLAAEVCGGCHSGSRHGTYNEWTNSPHAKLVEDFPESQRLTCGACHVGAARMAMLKNYEARQNGITNYLSIPSAADAAAVGTASCAVCHDPHSDALAAQLRNPMNSTNYYGYVSASTTVTTYGTNVFGQVSTNVNYANDVFSAQYNPNVQICGQCHNGRGVRWDGKSYSWNAASNAMVLGSSQSFSRGPHHSPQYNILIGILQPDYLTVGAQGVATNFFAAHSGGPRSTANTNQCVTCHMPTYAVNASGSTNYLGHTFAMKTNNCTICHGSVPNIEEWQAETTNSIAQVVALLNQWATVKGPALFGANYSKYLQNAWEYNNVGALSSITNKGPTGSDALLVPDAVKQARFNLYSVLFDGSMGVHNPKYIPFLIADAGTKVSALFTKANFAATATVGYAPFTVTFTNLGTGAGTYAWSFGDGGTTNIANPVYTYTNPGLYSVTFTADGTEPMTRTDYIEVVERPVVAFAANLTTIGVGMPVTFTNTSSNIGDVTAWRWQFNTKNSATRVNTDALAPATLDYTYTTNGTFSVYLRASTAAGSIYTTNVNYITVTNVP